MPKKIENRQKDTGKSSEEPMDLLHFFTYFSIVVVAIVIVIGLLALLAFGSIYSSLYFICFGFVAILLELSCTNNFSSGSIILSFLYIYFVRFQYFYFI